MCRSDDCFGRQRTREDTLSRTDLSERGYEITTHRRQWIDILPASNSNQFRSTIFVTRLGSRVPDARTNLLPPLDATTAERGVTRVERRCTSLSAVRLCWEPVRSSQPVATVDRPRWDPVRSYTGRCGILDRRTCTSRILTIWRPQYRDLSKSDRRGTETLLRSGWSSLPHLPLLPVPGHRKRGERGDDHRRGGEHPRHVRENTTVVLLSKSGPVVVGSRQKTPLG